MAFFRRVIESTHNFVVHGIEHAKTPEQSFERGHEEPWLSNKSQMRDKERNERAREREKPAIYVKVGRK